MNRPGSHRPGKSGPRKSGRPGSPRRPVPKRDQGLKFNIIERGSDSFPESPSQAAGSTKEAFRVLIAVHRPRFRGRCLRAAALVGWEVTALLNKQDPVGQVLKGSRPPDLLILSGDFGRQRDYAIFRAVQSGREKGMRLIGLVDDAETAPPGHPDWSPDQLCDICLLPPYKMTELRVLFSRLYEEMRGKPAPPPIKSGEMTDELDDEEGED